MKGNLIAVPVSTLATYDYSEPSTPAKNGKPKMIEPESGDPVDFRVRGSVDHIEGETAFVRVAFVNDKRASMASADDRIDGGDEDESGEGEGLESMAARLDKEAEEEF